MGIMIIIIIGALVAFILAGYNFGSGWTGFNGGYPKITTKSIIVNGKTVDSEQSPEKTLWDWLQLLVIPVVLAIGGYLLNLTLKRSEQDATLDNQREAALQGYIDKMSELLLKDHLRESILLPRDDSKSFFRRILRRLSGTSQTYLEVEPEEVQTIARVRTLTVLSRLDGVRKGSVLQFLYDSGLLRKDEPVVELHRADLREADLRGAVRLLTAESVTHKESCLNSDMRIERPASRSGTSWGGKPADKDPDLRARRRKGSESCAPC